jgi:putative CocE/NonD family hydrolase
VAVIEHCWIALADGCRLAARIWLPRDAEARPVPGILEYIPYRKRDATAWRDEVTAPYFAGHGYAYLRVDIRGNGESDGLMADEYTARELEDGTEVIAWIAGQSWCDGRVGLCGISWGGFNALQIAALRPAALEAIVTLCSTDDRYADDIHYMGGCLLNDNLTWSSQMLGYSARPPDPALVGAGWRETWLERLNAMPLLAANWLGHQRRDAYWKHGSVCEDLAAIEVPVYAMGGWADAYSNAIPRLLSGLQAPRKALIGPWAHAKPHIAHPGPRAGYLQECLRWWDHWLKGVDAGFMAEPLLRAYMLDGVRPAADYAFRPGHWVSEPDWPPAGIELWRLALNPGALDPEPGPETALTLRSPLIAGLNAGRFCPGMRQELEHPTDQRGDDACSLIFDGDLLEERVEVFGAPSVVLELASDRPVAQVAVRLCDLHPDGAATRITYGVLNLTHRDGHEDPRPLMPGQRIRVTVRLNDVAYAVPAGHRLRLAVSTNYWPLIWPAPEPVTLSLYTGASAVGLPVRLPRAEVEPAVPPAETAPVDPFPELEAPSCSRSVSRDVGAGEVVLETLDDDGLTRVPSSGIEIGGRVVERFSIHPEDPLSARAEAAWTVRVGRADWRTRTESRTLMWSDAEHFHLEARLEAYEGEARVFEKDWRETIKRDLV